MRLCAHLFSQIWLVAAIHLPSMQASYQQQHQTLCFDMLFNIQGDEVQGIYLLLHTFQYSGCNQEAIWC